MGSSHKFTTSYAYQKLYPEAEGTFKFDDRNHEVFDEEFLQSLRMELEILGKMKLRDDEFEWLAKGSIKYIPLAYWEWLRSFRFEPSKIETELDKDGHLHISVTDKLYKCTLYEVPILAIVSELRNKYFGYIADMNTMTDIIDKKINFANEHQLYFSEFGTRRRYSSNTMERIIRELKEKCPIYCTGTSNVYFAYKYGLKCQGTFPHEWVMFHAAIGGYKKANQRMLEAWQKVYHGNLGIALMDTYTTDVFLKEFSLELAKLFDGVRQDSGDEITIGNKVIDRYIELGINPMSKRIIFSNALDFKKYERIARYFKGQINVSAGIGTNITSDTGIEGYKPANIVMKLNRCRMTPREDWQKCIKISDDIGKHMGDKDEFNACLYALNISKGKVKE